MSSLFKLLNVAKVLFLAVLVFCAGQWGVEIYYGVDTAEASMESIKGYAESNYVPGELLIKVSSSQQLAHSYSAAGSIKTGLKSLDELNSRFGVVKMERIVRQPDQGQFIVSLIDSLPHTWQIYKLQIPLDTDIRQAVAEYKRNSFIEFAEPNYYIFQQSNEPDDTEFVEQWGLHNTGQTVNGTAGTSDADIDMPEAWDISTGSSTVTVAVIDSGVDNDHPDLADNLLEGWNFVDGNSDIDDPDGHGTHVAGIIGAMGNNGQGIAGVNWSVNIMPLRIFDDSGVSTVSMFNDALNYAVTNNVKIVNFSGGGENYSQAQYSATADARDNGVLLIAAAMNTGSNNDEAGHFYPSDYDLDNIISVAATDANDELASFSNYGSVSVDVGAPGVNIYSTVPDGSYAFYNGTSMAAPHVSGLAALLKSYKSDYTYLGIRNNIINNVDAIDSLNGIVVSGGRINATKTLSSIDADLPTATITYSTTEITNQDVIATLVPNESVIVVNNEGLDTYTFTENGSFTFEFTDLAGNPSSATATVDYLDKIVPNNPTAYSIYADNTKVNYLEPDRTFAWLNPYFEWTGASDGHSGLAGYYVYLDTTHPDNNEVDAVAVGAYQTDNFYTAPALTNEDTYYLYVKAADQAGNVSAGTYFPYIFSPPKTLGEVVGAPFIVTGTKQGGGPDVRIFNVAGQLLGNFMAYDSGFRGGVNVAVGDIDGNGTQEIITSPGPGGGPNIRVFDVEGNNLSWDFMAYDVGFRGGINLAVGDIEGDGKYEIAVAPVSGGSPNIRIFGWRDNAIVPTTENFLAYDAGFRGGIAISIGDIENDGLGDIITTPTSRGGPHIRIFGVRDRRYVPVTLGIMAYAASFRGGINSCIGDVNSDGRDEIITGVVSNGGPHVRIFGVGRNQEFELSSPGFMAFDPSSRGGVSITTVDTNGNGYDEIVTGAGGQGDPVVRIYNSQGRLLSPEFFAYSVDYQGGITLAAGNF